MRVGSVETNNSRVLLLWLHNFHIDTTSLRLFVFATALKM